MSRINNIPFIFFFLLVAKVQTLCQVHYVNHAAVSGANNGSDWQNAYTDLHSALNIAQFGDTVWVASGIYKPSSLNDRAAYFELKDGVRMFGGFEGIETSVGQRDWASNPTILSGDIGLQGDSTDNAYTILYIGLSDSTTVLDGFILRDGNSDGPDDTGFGDIKHSGGALNIEAKDGYAYPKIRNCRFEHNYAAAFGGGAYIEGKPSGSVAPQFINCMFVQNNSGLDGGGVYKSGGSWAEIKNDFIACSFEGNSTIRFGGGLFFTDNEGIDTFEVINCRFLGNIARSPNQSGRGGGFAILGGRTASGSNLLVDSCYFDGNIGLVADIYHTPFFFFEYFDYFELKHSLLSSVGKNVSFTFFGFNEEAAFINIQDCIFSNGYLSAESVTNKCYLTNCIFNGEGGNMISYPKKLYIMGCQFQNTGVPFTAGIVDSCFVSDCVFSGNSGAFQEETPSAPTITYIDNSTFYNNIIEIDVSQLNNYNTKFFIDNCIFKENTTFIPRYAPYDTLFFAKQVPFLSNNIQISTSLLDAENCDTASMLNIACGPGMLYGADPLFLDAAAQDFRLHPCSPARNAGSNAAALAAGIATDIAGLPRIQGGTVDMGAHETPSFRASHAIVTAQPCGPGALGTFTMALENGCPPFFVDWSDATGAAGASISDTSFVSLHLPSGPNGANSYTVIVTDGRMEADTVSFNLIQAAPPTLGIETTDVGCAGSEPSMGGTATAVPFGGTGPFEYTWSNAQSGASVIGLPAGPITVTITDANGCTASATAPVGLVGSLQVATSIVNPFYCAGEHDGVVMLQPLGGTPPFSYQWEGLPLEQSPTLDSIGPGSYAATVTDAFGCTGDVQFSFGEPTPVVVSVEIEQPACFGQMATATVSATGGTPFPMGGGYSYHWDDGSTAPSVSLVPGPHSVTATDVHGCPGTATIQVTEPSQLTASVAATPQSLCFGAENGQLAALPQGGTPPYSYHWGSGLATDSLLTNQGSGNYALTLTDANGCSATTVTDIAQLQDILLSDSITDATGPTAADGGVQVYNVAGGTGSGYQFIWSNGATTQNLTGVSSGDYSLTVTDGGGCTAIFSFHVDFNSATEQPIDNFYGAAIVPNPSGMASSAKLLLSKRPIMPVAYKIFDASGQLVAKGSVSMDHVGLPTGLAVGNYRVVLGDGEKRVVLSWVVVE